MKRKIFLVAFVLVAVFVLTGCAQSILPGTIWSTDFYTGGNVSFFNGGRMTYDYNTATYGSNTIEGTWMASGNRLMLKIVIEDLYISDYYTVRIWGKFMYLYDNSGRLWSTWARLQ